MALSGMICFRPHVVGEGVKALVEDHTNCRGTDRVETRAAYPQHACSYPSHDTASFTNDIMGVKVV